MNARPVCMTDREAYVCRAVLILPAAARLGECAQILKTSAHKQRHSIPSGEATVCAPSLEFQRLSDALACNE
jgi:hypothetical protein